MCSRTPLAALSSNGPADDDPAWGSMGVEAHAGERSAGPARLIGLTASANQAAIRRSDRRGPGPYGEENHRFTSAAGTALINGPAPDEQGFRVSVGPDIGLTLWRFRLSDSHRRRPQTLRPAALRREGAAATAGLGCIGIVKVEALPIRSRLNSSCIP